METPIQLDDLIKALMDEETLFPPKLLYQFSDLSSANTRVLREAWPNVPLQRRRNLVSDLVDLAESDPMLMFEEMGRIALEDAGKAMAAGDPGRAASVIENDAAIDALENEIDEMALQLLARTQPVAGDLRFVVSALRMVVDLERIGDEAVMLKQLQDFAPVRVDASTREVRVNAREAG